MPYLSTIELHKEQMTFSSGHFAILSETSRERLHGHTYSVHASLTALIHDNGLSFDYRKYRQIISKICDELNTRFLIPTESKYLTIEDKSDPIIVVFCEERIPFLKHDIKFLPVSNITVEELSKWFIGRLTSDRKALEDDCIQEITIRIFSGVAQSGSSHWKNSDNEKD